MIQVIHFPISKVKEGLIFINNSKMVIHCVNLIWHLSYTSIKIILSIAIDQIFSIRSRL